MIATVGGSGNTAAGYGATGYSSKSKATYGGGSGGGYSATSPAMTRYLKESGSGATWTSYVPSR